MSFDREANELDDLSITLGIEEKSEKLFDLLVICTISNGFGALLLEDIPFDAFNGFTW